MHKTIEVVDDFYRDPTVIREHAVRTVRSGPPPTNRTGERVNVSDVMVIGEIVTQLQPVMPAMCQLESAPVTPARSRW